MIEHTHTLVAQAHPVAIKDCDQWSLGCHVCGPQWEITVDWQMGSIRISWVHLPYSCTLFNGGATRQDGSGGV